MVLKIHTNTGWRFVDGIVELNHEQIDIERYNKEFGEHGRYWDAQFLYCHYFNPEKNHKIMLQPEFTSDLNSPVREIWFRWKHGEPQSYILDSEAYLMSDEGKTIERIN